MLRPKTTLNLSAQTAPPRADAGRYRVGPCAERRHHEVVETSDGAGYGQQFGLVAALFARDEHFGRGRGLGEWVFAVHLLDEVFAEGYEQYDSQESAEERRQEYLVEVGVESQYVERRQREDGSGDYHARAGAYRLYDDILSEHVLLAREVAYADGDDCDRYGGLEYLADLQPEECGCGREDDGHDYAHGYRVGRDFGRRARCGHHRLVGFAVTQFAVSVFGQRCKLSVFFHSVRITLLMATNLSKISNKEPSCRAFRLCDNKKNAVAFAAACVCCIWPLSG